MTAAKASAVISRLPGCAGEASDAVSACTHVKVEDAPDLLGLPKSECPTPWVRLPRSRCPKPWIKYKLLWYHLKDLHTDLHWQDYCWSDSSTNSHSKKIGITYHSGNRLFMHRERGLFLSVHVDDKKLTGKKKHLIPMWKKRKIWRTYFSTESRIYLECTQRECKANQRIVEDSRKIFESSLSAGTVKPLLGWATTWRGHAKTCVEQHCEIANKWIEQ